MEEKKLNKTEILEMVHKYLKETDSFVSKDKLKKVYDAIFLIIRKEIADGNLVCIRNFGIFSTCSIPERQGRNPITGESVLIPESKRYSFRGTENSKIYLNSTEDERFMIDFEIKEREIKYKNDLDYDDTDKLIFDKFGG